MDFLDELKTRGLLHQASDLEGLRAHLGGGRRSVYCGFDPTSDSLTIGNLVPMLYLARFQRAGHRPVVVMGGGTGLIGDPSGKDAERSIRSREEVDACVASQRRIFDRVLDFSGPNAAIVVNNADWLCRISYIEALRDIGKHFAVNMMIQRDSVRERLNNREQGISYTEFSYMLLQAYDFLHLYREHGVTVQGAGSDQWGNIVAGVDLVRRSERAEVFGITHPLVTKADGTKFGKSESGAVWLTRERTSPYAFYQFWLNSADADVGKYLRFYTFLPEPEIQTLLSEHEANPGARAAQRVLAQSLTKLLHGDDGLAEAEAATQALFSGEIGGLSKAALEELFASAPSSTLPRTRVEGEGAPLLDLLVEGAVVKSKREAREFLEQGAILLDGRRAALDTKVSASSLLHGEMALVRRGKKAWHVLRFSG
ncbi:MAG TPA: tyrosine--tRNA ligase [Polyangiaceae bacterium]